MTSNTPAKLLNTEQAAALLGIQPSTLAIWRCAGKGPRFIKVGKLVRYHQQEIVAWIDGNTHVNTSHHGCQSY